jgi:hypothetical protein
MAPSAPAAKCGGHGFLIGSAVVIVVAGIACLVLWLTGVIPTSHKAAPAVVVPVPVATSVDCSLGPWSDWGDCTPDGTRSRTRVATVQPANGGQACGALIDTQPCTYIAPFDDIPFVTTTAGMVGGKLGPGLTWKQAVGAQGANGFTTSLWFSAPNVVTQQQLLNGWRTAAGADVGPFTWQLVIRDKKVQFGGSTVNYKEAATAGTLSPGRWNHVAMVFDGVNTITLYLNGVKSATSWTNTLYNDAHILLGVLGGGGQVFTGQMKNFAIFAGALSDAACNSLYIHATELTFLSDAKKVLLHYDTAQGFVYS